MFDKIPRYDDPAETQWGMVAVDHGKCTGCALCVKICPADVLSLVNKRSQMVNPAHSGCIACGDCLAICSKQAISLVRSSRFSGLFATSGEGDPALPRLFG